MLKHGYPFFALFRKISRLGIIFLYLLLNILFGCTVTQKHSDFVQSFDESIMCDYLTPSPHEDLQFFLPNFQVVVFIYVPRHCLGHYFT